MNPFVKRKLFKAVILFVFFTTFTFAATGKPSAPIYITSVKQFTVEPEVETQISVQLDVSQYQSGILTVVLDPDDSIVLVDTDSEYEFLIDTHTQKIDLPVKFYASQSGHHYLMMTVAMEDENFNVQAKSMGVVIDAGEQALAQKQMMQDMKTADVSEGGIKSMPAEEVIY